MRMDGKNRSGKDDVKWKKRKKGQTSNKMQQLGCIVSADESVLVACGEIQTTIDAIAIVVTEAIINKNKENALDFMTFIGPILISFCLVTRLQPVREPTAVLKVSICRSLRFNGCRTILFKICEIGYDKNSFR